MSAGELTAAIERAMKKRDHPSSDTLGFTTLTVADFDTIMKALSDRTPPAPMEAVAWRWRIEDAQCPAWEYADTRPGLLPAPHVTIQPLYTHPPQPDAPGWRDIATAPRDGAMLLVGYDDGVARVGAMPDSQRVFEARWNDVQGTWSARNGFLLHSDATHWQPLPPPPSADSLGGDVAKRSEPDALPGDLREKVIGDLEALKVRLEVESVSEPDHVKSGVWWDYSITVDEAIALLIQSEKGGA